MISKGCGVSFQGKENILKLPCNGCIILWIYKKNYWIVHVKWANCILWELYDNKAKKLWKDYPVLKKSSVQLKK